VAHSTLPSRVAAARTTAYGKMETPAPGIMGNHPRHGRLHVTFEGMPMRHDREMISKSGGRKVRGCRLRLRAMGRITLRTHVPA